ncbi:MAG: DUF3320 domain-containing protein [Bacteroidia bacterium]|nr:DUF3320 domain-containing protein [Bacteroidia bacterium]
MENTLILHKEYIPFLSISLYLNKLLPVQNLIIENTSDNNSGEIEVKITSDIPCIEPFNAFIADIPAQESVKVSLDTMRVNRTYLSSISETEKAVLKIEVWQNNNAQLIDYLGIDVHQLEYFSGFRIFPELISTYITPNHPYVYHIKRKAVEILENQKLTTAFEGYQSDNIERVLQMMSAIYTAIQSEEIVYSSIPPGYEQTGQRLRLLHTIQQERFGNCIDISLLFAACLEAIDLNPIIVVTEGHAFVGCWLYDNKFAEIINDDKTAITKRLAKGIREMAVIEATSVCKGNDMDFVKALNLAEMQLIEKEDFILSVDVKRARTAGMRPLPLINDSTGTQLDEELIDKHIALKMIENFEIGTIYTDDELNSTQPKTKQKIWERKLLDLSLRNNLLNIRMTRNMLQLVDIDINHLEDTLADGRTFSILPHPRAEILKKYNLFAQALHHSSPLYQTANDELKYNRLMTYYHQEDLDNILNHIHKNAKLAIEENGSSTLYLAVGLLKWFDRKTPEQARYSPILLIPVEINRRSVNSKYTLKSREEETMMNITLLEFLRQEYQLSINALNQLPYDEKGVDVPKVMGILRRAVMQLKGWDVEEQLILGNFSFSKLILWKDIVLHQDKLLESEIVRSLTEGKLTEKSVRQQKDIESFEKIHPALMALPIPTDVSQMNAVLSAQNGESFILHGPPGTGKSQTITNIIADALFREKRVLFVAAKKAALDVVYNRLEQIGLGPFSLELHSNKSKKSDVLSQLAASLDVSRKFDPIDFQREADRLNQAKNAIGSYAEVLHQKQPVGWSLYDDIVQLETLKSNGFPKNLIPEEVLNQLNPALWQNWEDWLFQFKSIITQITHPKENPFSRFKTEEFSSATTDFIIRQTPLLAPAIATLKNKTSTAQSALHFPFSVETGKQLNAFAIIAMILSELPNAPVNFCRNYSSKENREIFDEWRTHFQKYQTALQQLLSAFNRNVLELDVSALELQWKQAGQKWFLPRLIKKNKLKKQLELYKKSKWDNEAQVEKFFAEYASWKEEKLLLSRERFDWIKKSLKSLYREEETDLPQIEKRTAILEKIIQQCTVWGINSFDSWMKFWAQNNIESTDEIILPKSTILSDFIINQQALQQQLTDYANATGINFNQIAADAVWFDESIGLAEQLTAHLPQLNAWINYKRIVAEGEKLSLQWFIGDFEKQVFPTTDAADYFHFTAHSSLARNIIARNEPLHLFNATLFENKIEQYKQIATQFRELTRKELLLKLTSQVPNTTREAMQSSEIGILQRAIKNKGRAMSIRRLFDQIPTLLPRIAPCMLMSPISTAQYFDVDANHFDLVIFDEASQLPTCEAVSALARAKQAIIVGDPKQMPPTSFFSTTKIDEENIEIEDLESILDDCLALSIPSLHLLRHYRSKHESLIAFSNANYYDNKLLTFPSADDISRKLSHHPVPGYYDKGKTRQNKFEAEAIVEFIKNHFRHSANHTKSVGVVTFSQAQQNLVEDILQQAFMLDSQLEQLAMESNEPLFIKNLENVQGDERDIILFSVCYAPDSEGKMSMNFGPLNRNGGWRRLNVAVTRARYEMHVFATVRSEQIDLARTSSEGVAGLKSFLQYAESGHLPISSDNRNSISSDTKSLASVVSQKLVERGLKVKSNIGTSGFKVDVGVVHPNNPHQYILGILIDGKYYFDAQTTNDREMVMPSVLRVLGWNIFRIWTMDWIENADRIADTIAAKVEELKNGADTEIPLPVEKPPFLTDTQPEKLPQTVNAETEVRNETPSNNSLQIDYTACYLPIIAGGNSDTVYDYHNRETIKKQILDVIQQEAPISKNLLYRRVLAAWNTSRVGAKLDAYLQTLMQGLNIPKTNHHQPFYWNAEILPETLKNYRSNMYEKRAMEDIAPEELVIAIEEAVQENLSINEEELRRYIANLFGFAKVGKNIDALLRYAINLAVEKGKIKRENGRVGVR